MDEGDDVNCVGTFVIGLIASCVGVIVGSGLTVFASGTGIEEGIDIDVVSDKWKDMDVVCIELSPRRRFNAAMFLDQKYK
jgi:hypothetical protein